MLGWSLLLMSNFHFIFRLIFFNQTWMALSRRFLLQTYFLLITIITKSSSSGLRIWEQTFLTLRTHASSFSGDTQCFNQLSIGMQRSILFFARVINNRSRKRLKVLLHLFHLIEKWVVESLFCSYSFVWIKD